MPTTCVVDFESNPMKVIYAGQLLRGTVKLVLTNEKNVRGVYINIHGKAYCHWTTGSGKSRRSHTGSEEYLDERTYFVGSRDGDEFRLAPGTYDYSFQCMLPQQLPTSFEGDIGYIRYTARVVLDIPLWPDKEFENPFTVIRAIDLNAMPELKVPVIVEKNKKFFFCCLLCCFSSRPLWIYARTPVGGYTPGQTINVELNVKNDSDQPVACFSVQLLKQVTYHTYKDSSRKKIENISIIEEETRGCDVNKNEIIRINMLIPPIPPTDVATSNIVKVKYLIRIIGSVACFHNNPVLELPITIGSYPIQDVFSAFSNDTSAPLLSGQNAFPTAPSDDPPTYEEALHSKNPEGDNFKPKYPMFRRRTSYSIGE